LRSRADQGSREETRGRGGRRAVSDPLGGLSPEPEPVEAPQPPVKQKRPFTPTTWAILGSLAAAFAAEALVGHDPAVESSVAPVLAAGASGGLFGLFGGTVALAWRLRHRIPPEARRSVFRRILFTLLINVAIAAGFPVDSAAHLGGLISGIALGLLAPLSSMPRQAWHRLTQYFLIACALLLAAMEGAAFARAVKPKPR